jgi:tRNA A37 N6-isopentenylltransferase MiaA
MSWFRRDNRIHWFDFEDPETTALATKLVRDELDLGQ